MGRILPKSQLLDDFELALAFLYFLSNVLPLVASFRTAAADFGTGSPQACAASANRVGFPSFVVGPAG